LLKEMGRSGRRPYFAFRMGILGRIAADLSFPFPVVGTESTDQLTMQQFESDVDRITYTVNYQEEARRLVLEPGRYFPPKRTDLEAARLLIDQAYENGEGFNGFARRAAEREFNRAIESVSDLWHTVLDQTAVVYQSPPNRTSVENYHFQEIAYFLEVGRPTGAVQAVQEMESRGLLGVANGLKAAKLFYNADRHDEALTFFNEVLRLDPGNDEARTLMTDHYVKLGEDLIEAQAYDSARDSLSSALGVSPQDDRVAERLQEVSRLIVQRESRRARATRNVSEGNRLLAEARTYVMQRDFAGALDSYNTAAMRYQAVGREFPAQQGEAAVQLSSLQESLGRLRLDLVNQVVNLHEIALDSSREKLLHCELVGRLCPNHRKRKT